MKTMKSLIRMFVILSVLIFIPVSSYAIVDAEVYGGVFWGGKVDTGTTEGTGDMDIGYSYGGRGHLNMGIPLLLTVGLGGFYQKAPLSYEILGVKMDLMRKTYGIDMYAQLDLIPVIHPYFRAGWAIKETIEMEVQGPGGVRVTNKLEKNWGSSYYGFGVGLTIFPLLKIYGEYLYTSSKVENDVEMKGNAFNLGARLSI